MEMRGVCARAGWCEAVQSEEECDWSVALHSQQSLLSDVCLETLSFLFECHEVAVSEMA